MELEYGVKTEKHSLNDVLSHHIEIAMNIGKRLKPLVAFKEYLKYGYFPFYKEDKDYTMEGYLYSQ
jgi:hypothetical protein